jgi:hypothetical protein
MSLLEYFLSKLFHYEKISMGARGKAVAAV